VSRECHVRAVDADERGWLAEHLVLTWGSTEIVSGGRMRDASQLAALMCTDGEELLGLATFEIAAGECELLTIEAFSRREGVGSALLAEVIEAARAGGCDRLHLVTTNDNVGAQRFYERHGLRLVAVHRGAVDAARALKPEIPLLGEGGVEIHDELELELRLNDGAC
jgi:ribosomal protein S18 acetylase RimI-like enzyme